ncbi:MAG TPA: oxygenase MpaB family protein [Methylomirabilota bacterium]|jgi:uncharacterized protein (DUF2236 family)
MPDLHPADLTDGIAHAGMAWRIHRERVLLAGWGRAILLQLAHPMVAQGVADHSAFTTEPWGWLRRLDRTLRSMLALTFGTTEQVTAAASRINAIHDRVHGRLGEAAGGEPAGAGYDAHDPALLTWVHATLLDSFLLAYRLFVAPLDRAAGDRYCAEASGIEPLLGIPAGRLPRTEAQLQDYLETTVSSGAIEVTGTARRLSREILAPPVPRLLRPALRLAALPAVGLLPPDIRAAYGLTWSRGQARALDVLAAVSRRALPLTPCALRYWPDARLAERRLGPR